MVPGFNKCGTTTLCTLLAEHPQLFIPDGEAKEPNLFQLPNFHEHWGRYAEFFENERPGTLLGEGSQEYSGFQVEEMCRERILTFYPHIKLIFIARDPIDRIESSYREFHHSGYLFGDMAPYDLGQALDAFPQMLENSKYLTRLNNYRLHMPEEQILVLFAEDLAADPDTVLSRCFTFLGVDPTVRISHPRRRLNTGSHKLYDTERLREMRNTIWSPETGLALQKLDLGYRDQFLEKLGLRQRFTGEPMEWNSEIQGRVVEALGEDISKFLEAYGKPLSFWPRFKKMVSPHGG